MISSLESQLVSLQKGPFSNDGKQKLDNLVKVVQESSSQIGSALTTTADTVKFVAVICQIETLYSEYGGDKRQLRHELKDVRRLARSYFTMQSARSKYIRASLNKIHELKWVNLNFFFRTLAAWIAKHHIPFQNLGLTEFEFRKLAPYLTYIKLNMLCDEQPLGDLLSRTRRLKQLKLTNCYITGRVAFSKFRHTGHLKRLVIERCPHLCNPLPQGMTALQTLHLVRCKDFNQKLPEGMNQLRKLKIEHCPKYDHPLPMDLTSLKELSIRYVLKQITDLPKNLKLKYRGDSDEKIECRFRRFPYLDFLVPIYLADRERALHLADSLGIWEMPVLKCVFEKIGSYPQIDIQSMIKKIPAPEIQNLIYEILTHRAIESYPQNMVVALFKTEAGIQVIFEKRSLYLEDVQLKEIFLAAYPPSIPENLYIYPMKSEVRNDVLHLTIAPTMARMNPDPLVDFLLQTPIKDFRITYYGSDVKEGEDREGQKLFLAELSQGIIHASKKYKLKTTANGQVHLHTNEYIWTFTGPLWEIVTSSQNQIAKD